MPKRDYTKQPQIVGQWMTVSEQVKFDTDHALLVLPDGPNGHRLYYGGSPVQLAQMLSVILEFAEKLPVHITALAEKIRRDNPGTDEFR